jgi:hypothetical protein
MTTITLEKEKKLWRGAIPWVACNPFLDNNRAVLIHRVRHVTTHKIGSRWPSHISIHCWCGNTMTGTKKFTFLSRVPDDRILCARCDDKAIESGRPSASDLSGKHVHTGGVVAIKRCCQQEPTP